MTKKSAPARPLRKTGPTARSRPTARFLLRFCILFAVCELVFAVGLVGSSTLEAVLSIQARGAAALLSWSGVEVASVGTQLVSTLGRLEVRHGCDGLQPIALYAAALLAFPSGMSSRAVALGAGLAVLILLNVVRVSTLYAAITFRPTWFETLHVAVWPFALLLATLSMWALWARRVVRSVE